MVRWRSLVCKVHSEPLRLLPGSKRLSVVALALMATVPATILPAQFVLWQKFPISQPFSVTTAVRGLITTTGPEGPTPQVRFEGLTGYFTPAGNRFDYHSSVAVDAQEPVPGTLVIDTRNPIPFTDSGVQSAFNGLCCSNNAFGTDIDTSIYPVTDFSVPESFEVTIGVPEVGEVHREEEPALGPKEK